LTNSNVQKVKKPGQKPTLATPGRGGGTENAQNASSGNVGSRTTLGKGLHGCTTHLELWRTRKKTHSQHTGEPGRRSHTLAGTSRSHPRKVSRKRSHQRKERKAKERKSSQTPIKSEKGRWLAPPGSKTGGTAWNERTRNRGGQEGDDGLHHGGVQLPGKRK